MRRSFLPFLHRQIPVMILLSVFPGLGYILLGWLQDLHQSAIIWYLGILLTSAWGYRLYRTFDPERMSRQQRTQWHRQVINYNYLFFALWTAIFLVYAWEVEARLHYIAIFTQIGASTVAAVLLYPEPKLFKPLIPIKMGILAAYFAGIGEWYSYVLAVFACIFAWVLYYSASNSYRLLLKTSHQATHDMLTGLPNRQFFVEQLQQTINTLRDSGRHSYLMLIDLDYFKTVNDSLGHDLGDQLLQEVASRLERVLPENDVLARLGGDEFIVIGHEIEGSNPCLARAQQLAHDMLDTLKAAYVIQGHNIHISASIGIRLIRPGEESSTHLVREADIAMYEAKAAGRDGVILFSEGMYSQVEHHLEIERLLHFALENDEIKLLFQPQVDGEQRVIGAECLARWDNRQHGLIPPGQFIPVAEKTGLIIELGNHIMATAFQTMKDWHEQGILLDQLSINISVRQFMNDEFVFTVRQLADTYLNEELRRHIVFEITESLVAEDIHHIVSTMQLLRSIGIRFSMDDFGTGYSSLSSLKRFPINEVKIDQTFINDLCSDSDNQAMVITILSIARFFNLTVVGEGIESEAQFDFLRDYRCEIFQGNHFGRPMTDTEFMADYRERANPGAGK